jgi:hypothetical protein
MDFDGTDLMDIEPIGSTTLDAFITLNTPQELLQLGITNLQNDLDPPLTLLEPINDMSTHDFEVVLYCKQMHHLTTWDKMKWVRKKYQYTSIPLSMSGKPDKLDPQNLKSLQKLYDYFVTSDEHRPDFLGAKKIRYEPLAAPVLSLGKLPSKGNFFGR